MTRVVIYDLDGTLVDSGQTVADILNGMRSECGLAPKDSGDLIPWLSLGGENLIRNALNLADENDIAEALYEFRLRYSNQPTDPHSVYPGIPGVLDALRSQGLSLGVCTNKPRSLAEKVLAETGLDRYFSFMNAGGDLSTQKPNPRNLLSCLDFFDVSTDEAILVGDSLVDQTMARCAKVPFIFFRRGYDDGVDGESIDRAMDRHDEILSFLTFEEKPAE